MDTLSNEELNKLVALTEGTTPGPLVVDFAEADKNNPAEIVIRRRWSDDFKPQGCNHVGDYRGAWVASFEASACILDGEARKQSLRDARLFAALDGNTVKRMALELQALRSLPAAPVAGMQATGQVPGLWPNRWNNDSHIVLPGLTEFHVNDIEEEAKKLQELLGKGRWDANVCAGAVVLMASQIGLMVPTKLHGEEAANSLIRYVARCEPQAILGLCAALRAALTAPAAAPVAAVTLPFYSMDAAPKDGTWVLLETKAGAVTAGYWDAEFDFNSVGEGEEIQFVHSGQWTDDTVESWGYQTRNTLEPVRWAPMPLPTAPQQPEQKGGSHEPL